MDYNSVVGTSPGERIAWEIVQNHFEGGRGECTALKRSPSGFTGGRQPDAQFGKLGKIVGTIAQVRTALQGKLVQAALKGRRSAGGGK